MNNPRIYGKPPFSVAVIHGGPGAGGEMEPVARELSSDFGVLEPLQTATTLDGQVKELSTVLEAQADFPVTLIGFSWGAWLSYIVTAKYPELVKKLILVGSGPYEYHYARQIQEARLSRLNADEQVEYREIIQLLDDPKAEDKAQKFARLGQLAHQADHYDPIEVPSPATAKQKKTGEGGNPFHGVLKAAQEMRQSGTLLALTEQIQCPVVALHGEYDPHPADGVRVPLAAQLKDFRFITLENCGHKPWIERQAKNPFYAALRGELLVD